MSIVERISRYRSVLRGAFLCAIAAACLALVACGESKRPNIILISIDCMRADRIGAYGFDLDITPNLDRLAEQGVRYAQAISHVGQTFPSHATMLTGLYPRQHGVRDNGHMLAMDRTSLVERLDDIGYDTAAVVAFRAMLHRGQMGQGFDFLSDPEYDPDAYPIRTGADVTEVLNNWLGERAERPFFAWMHLFEPHGPYRPNQYSIPRLSDYDGFLKDGASVELLTSNDVKRAVGENIDALQILYEGEVQLADQHIGELLAALEANGQLDNTIVIVTGDHGQGIGEYGNFGHGARVNEYVMHIPLIIADFRRDGGHVIYERVGNVDLAPTILELADAPPLSETSGRSLVNTLDGTEPEEKVYFAEVPLKAKALNTEWYDPNLSAAYAGQFKLVQHRGEEELFEVAGIYEREVPGDEDDFGYRDYLSGELREFLESEGWSSRANLTDEDIAELKSLGYIQ